MRTAIILCLVCAAAVAAERETFTLKDGRTLVGVYDEPSATLRMDHGAMPLRADAIADRAPAPKADAKASAIAAKTAPAKKTAETPADIVAGSDAAEQAEKDRHEKALADVAHQMRLRLAEWATHARIEDGKVPTLPADPRDSDRAALREANMINAELMTLRQARDVSHLDGEALGQAAMAAFLRLKDAGYPHALDDR